MSKIRPSTRSGDSKNTSNVVHLPRAFGKQLSIAPILIIGLFIGGSNASEAFEKRARDLTAHVYSARGNFYEAEGQWNKALAHYSVALSASSEPISVHYTDCGRMCTKLGDFDKAITYFSKGLLPESDITS